jgi:hypothetical protein
MLKMEDERVWAKFVEFFRNVKGYEDWSEDDIEFSRNQDDEEEFVKWLITGEYV